MYNGKNNINNYSLPFAAWEMRLFLDTHPNDKMALETYNKLCAMGGGNNYACNGIQNGESWTWINDPWPWEAEANRVEVEE